MAHHDTSKRWCRNEPPLVTPGPKTRPWSGRLRDSETARRHALPFGSPWPTRKQHRRHRLLALWAWPVPTQRQPPSCCGKQPGAAPGRLSAIQATHGSATAHPHVKHGGGQTTIQRTHGFPDSGHMRVPHAVARTRLPQTGVITIFGTVARRHELTRSVHAEAAKACGHPPGRGLSSGTGRAIKCPGERPDTAHGKRRHHRADNRRAWCVSRGVRRTGTRQSIVVAHDAMPRLSGAIARASG